MSRHPARACGSRAIRHPEAYPRMAKSAAVRRGGTAMSKIEELHARMAKHVQRGELPGIVAL